MKTIEMLREPQAAAAILAHPLRVRILGLARTAGSASDFARQLGQPRQRVNYHVRRLAEAGFLIAAGRLERRNMVEQQYVASASTYLLAPEVLGEVAPGRAESTDPASAERLAVTWARAQSELGRLIEAAGSAGLRVRATSLENEIQFASAEDRAAFMQELANTVHELIAEYRADAGGQPFRLILGCYPVPAGT